MSLLSATTKSPGLAGRLSAAETRWNMLIAELTNASLMQNPSVAAKANTITTQIDSMKSVEFGTCTPQQTAEYNIKIDGIDMLMDELDRYVAVETPNGTKITTALDFTQSAPADCTVSPISHTHSNVADKCFTWESNTLTMNNLNLETTADTGIRLPTGAAVVMNGTSTVTSTYNGADTTYGIYGAGALTFDGSGSLTANGGTSTGSGSTGVYADITVSGGGTVNANGGTATNGRSYGVSVGLIAVFSGTLNATGGQAGTNSTGVHVGNTITVSGGTLNATGTNSALSKAPTITGTATASTNVGG